MLINMQVVAALGGKSLGEHLGRRYTRQPLQLCQQLLDAMMFNLSYDYVANIDCDAQCEPRSDGWHMLQL